MGQNFRANGYATYQVGKWHNDMDSHRRSFSGGRCIFNGGMFDHFDTPVWDIDATGDHHEDNKYVALPHSSEAFASAAIGLIEEHDVDAEPFFLCLAFTSPHDPRTAPQEYHDKYSPDDIELPPNYMAEHPFDNGEMIIRDEELTPYPRTETDIKKEIADYYAMIHNQNDQMNRVIDALETKGILDNTIVVYTGDHGLAVGQHALLGKQNCYDHSIRIPFMLMGPGVDAGKQINDLVYSFDIYPTLCELAGIEIPESVTGQSCVPIMSGETSGREFIYSFYKDIMTSYKRPDGWKLIRYHKTRDIYGGSSSEGCDRVQLFNVNEDPWEINDLSEDASHADLVNDLQEAMKAAQVEFGDPLAEHV